MWFLYKLVDQEFGPSVAEKAVLYYSLFPTGVFFSAAYTESVFMLFVIGAFYFAVRERWLLAGLLGFLASLTRNLGGLLIIPLGYLYLKQINFSFRNIRTDILALCLIPAGLLLYMIYLYYFFGDSLAFVHAQKYWDREFMLPWVGLINSGIKEAGPSLVFLGLMAVSFIRLPLYYSIYFAFILLIPMTMGVRWEGQLRLYAMLRYILPCFPAMIVLAELGRSRVLNVGILASFVLGLVFFTVLFAKGFFIA